MSNYSFKMVYNLQNTNYLQDKDAYFGFWVMLKFSWCHVSLSRKKYPCEAVIFSHTPPQSLASCIAAHAFIVPGVNVTNYFPVLFLCLRLNQCFWSYQHRGVALQKPADNSEPHSTPACSRLKVFVEWRKSCRRTHWIPVWLDSALFCLPPASWYTKNGCVPWREAVLFPIVLGWTRCLYLFPLETLRRCVTQIVLLPVIVEPVAMGSLHALVVRKTLCKNDK